MSSETPSTMAFSMCALAAVHADTAMCLRCCAVLRLVDQCSIRQRFQQIQLKVSTKSSSSPCSTPKPCCLLPHTLVTFSPRTFRSLRKPGIARCDYSLNSLVKGGYIGDYMGKYYRAYSGDTRNLDYGSYGPQTSSSSGSTRAAGDKILPAELTNAIAAGAFNQPHVI